MDACTPAYSYSTIGPRPKQACGEQILEVSIRDFPSSLRCPFAGYPHVNEGFPDLENADGAQATMDPPHVPVVHYPDMSLFTPPQVIRSSSNPVLSSAHRIAQSHRTGQAIQFEDRPDTYNISASTSQPLSILRSTPSTEPGPSSSVVSGQTGQSGSNRRRRERPRPAPGTALGLEEEADFGSDEDVIGEVGEIDIPVVPISDSKRKGKNRLRITPTEEIHVSSYKGRKNEKLAKKGLADSELVLGPGWDGTEEKDEKKKKGFMSSLRGLGKQKDSKGRSLGEGSLASKDSTPSFAGSGSCESQRGVLILSELITSQRRDSLHSYLRSRFIGSKVKYLHNSLPSTPLLFDIIHLHRLRL